MSTRIPVVLLTLVAVLILCIPTATSAQSMEAGKARLTKPFHFMGKTFDKGTYKVGLERTADGMAIVVASKDNVKLFSELAIAEETKGKVGKPRASFAYPAGDPRFVRLEVRVGTMRYLAFFEKAS